MIFSKKTPRPAFAVAPERILIIKPSAIGDVVHTLPILNLLRKRWPAAQISWLLTPGCAGLLEGHPQLDQIIPFDRKLFGSTWKSYATASKLLSFSTQLRRQRFDLVIDLQGLFRSGLLAMTTGADCRVGSTSDREFGWMFCTHLAPIESAGQHAIERYLSVAEFLGLGREPVEFIFPTNAKDRDYVDALLPKDQRFAVLLPTTQWPTKHWPIEKFAALVKPLQERFGLTTILSGGSQSTAMSSLFPQAIDLTGKTTLRQLVALLERADLVIANDTGPMHIASALGRPLVTMFGPTSPMQTGPYQRMESVIRLDLACSPCFSRRCSHHSCMRQLEVECVLSLAAEQLTSHARSHAEQSLQVLR